MHTLRFRDGREATLTDDMVWSSPDQRLAEYLNAAYPAENRGPSDPDPASRMAAETAAETGATIVAVSPSEPEPETDSDGRPIIF